MQLSKLSKRILRDKKHALHDELVTCLTGMVLRSPQAMIDEIEDVMLTNSLIESAPKSMKEYLKMFQR